MKKAKTEVESALLKIDKGIPAPTNRIYGATLEATLKVLKPIAVSTDVKDQESVTVPYGNRYTLKARLAKFGPGKFATRTKGKISITVWKISAPTA